MPVTLHSAHCTRHNALNNAHCTLLLTNNTRNNFKRTFHRLNCSGSSIADNSVNYRVYSAHYIVASAPCTVHRCTDTIQCMLHFTQCTVNNAQCTVQCTAVLVTPLPTLGGAMVTDSSRMLRKCTLKCLQWAVYIVQCTFCSIKCAVFTVQCTVCIA